MCEVRCRVEACEEGEKERKDRSCPEKEKEWGMEGKMFFSVFLSLPV